MTNLMKVLTATAGVAALAAVTPAAAQTYGYQYPYNQQGYQYPNSSYSYPNSRYSYPNGTYSYPNGAYGSYGAYGTNRYGAYGTNASYAAERCSSTVEARLQNRSGLPEAVNILLGRTGSPQVNQITETTAMKSGSVRVKGLATSSSGWGPYGVGAYGALGYNYASNPDLEFRCTVARNGQVTKVDIRRR